MKILKKHGRDDLAIVYIGETPRGRVEFVESLEPPHPRDQKWVLIVSSLYGCPIECEICDAGGDYRGRLSAGEILSQIDYMVSRRYPDKKIPAKKFKIQFARIGEPALNENVLEVLEKLPYLFDAPGLMPCLSTIAPAGSETFFENLLEIKNQLYPRNFQLQFSIHSTIKAERDRIIPVKKWNLEQIAEYGTRFYASGGRKITLNFVLTDGYTIEPDVIEKIFPPRAFFIKMTPLNPTYKAASGRLKSGIDIESPPYKEPRIAAELSGLGYDILVSIGEPEENLIGSNCGQYIKTFEEFAKRGNVPPNSYLLKMHHLVPDPK